MDGGSQGHSLACERFSFFVFFGFFRFRFLDSVAAIGASKTEEKILVFQRKEKERTWPDMMMKRFQQEDGTRRLALAMVEAVLVVTVVEN